MTKSRSSLSLLMAPIAVGAAILATAQPVLAGPTARPPTPAHSSPAKPSANAITWAVQPSTAKGPDRRSTFTYTNLKPRTVVHDYVGVTNYSKHAVTFRVYATDAFVTSKGSLDLLPASKRPVDVGSWVHVQRTTIAVPAGARVNEPVTLTIPDNATPGDHTGGIVASISATAKNAAGQPVTVDRRLGVPVYLRVSGPLRPALTIESLATGFHGTGNPFGGGGTNVSYTVHNTGNVRLSGTQSVTVTGPFGITLATAHPPALPQLLPGNSYRVTAKLSGVFPAGPLTARVRVTPIEPSGVPPAATAPSAVSRSASLWATPWPQLLLLLALLAGGFGVLWWVRWRRKARAGALAAAVERGRHEATEELVSGAGRPADPSYGE